MSKLFHRLTICLDQKAIRRHFQKAVAIFGILFAFSQEGQSAITSFSFDKTGNQTTQGIGVAGAPILQGATPSQVVNPGSITGFSIIASSSSAATYQWYFNGVAINGATKDSLLLSNVTSANDGNYTVKVTNGSGNVTSSVYRLGVDSNGNGLPDAWELTQFGNLSQAASGDFDGDDILNIDEYLNDTNPKVREVYYWIAANGDFNTASNWSRNRVPGIGDTAVVNTGTFTLPANVTTNVSTVTVNAPFTAPTDSDYTLYVSGNWTFNGPFTLTSGKQFGVTGGGNVTVAGSTILNGANLVADYASKLSFPSVTTYTVPAGTSATWFAVHSDSQLSFPNLTAIIGPVTPGTFLNLQAVGYNGTATVSLPALTSITKPDDGDASANSGVSFFRSIQRGGLYAETLDLQRQRQPSKLLFHCLRQWSAIDAFADCTQGG